MLCEYVLILGNWFVLPRESSMSGTKKATGYCLPPVIPPLPPPPPCGTRATGSAHPLV